MIGLGVTGREILLAASSLGADTAAGAVRKRTISGKVRARDDLQDHELAILVACGTFIDAMKVQRESGQVPMPEEMKLVSQYALIPLFTGSISTGTQLH